MQYLVSVIDDTAGLATEDEMAAINVFNDRLQAEGHWVFASTNRCASSPLPRQEHYPHSPCRLCLPYRPWVLGGQAEQIGQFGAAPASSGG
jgi:hypothetical protein